MKRKLRRTMRSGAGGSMPIRGGGTDSGFATALLAQGQSLWERGHDEEAMEIAKQVVRLDPTDEAKLFFVQCLRQWTYFPGAEELRDTIVRAWREAWGTLSDLFGISFGLLSRDPVFGPLLRRVAAARPHRLALPDPVDAGTLRRIASDPLLLALLQFGRIIDLDLERAVTTLRSGLLDIAGSDQKATPELVQFACALAQYCFNNEYVFDLTADESARADQLRERITDAMARGQKLSPLAVPVLAAYQRLDALPASASLGRRTWPPPVAALVDQQIRQPAGERKYRESIPRITPIADDTSRDVQNQYEQNPYPRWARVPPATHQMPVDQWFSRDFPFSPYRPTGKTSGFDVLIAGCGTGRHAVLFAQVCSGAHILAVDLSLASLCYATHKTQALGISNIEYAQADILELGTLGRSFDVISSSGVLHHLADPELGWRTLLKLLRPDGCMQVGLYSEQARAGIAAAQAWLHARNYEATVTDIRRARQDLAAAAADDPSLRSALEFADFYALSECRDLLFPAHEVRFTIPRIQAFIDQNGLQFIGFLLSPRIQSEFCRRFSRERLSDLTLWHAFEAENPGTFRGMYDFWVQKRAP